MATMAEMLVGSVLESSQKAPDISGSLTKGAELASTIQGMQQRREALELQKQEHHMNKVNRVMDAFEKGANFKDKAAQNAYFKNYLPGMIKALKVDDVFGDEIMQFAQGSEEVRNKMLGLRLDVQDKINSGELRGGAILDYVKGKLTPEELATFDGEALLEQQKYATGEAFKTQRAETVQFGQAQRQATQIGSAGEVAAAQGAGKEYADYTAAGGKATLEKNLSRLEDAAKKLESEEVKTGKLSAAVPGLRSDVAQDILNPDIAAVRDDVRGAIQATLRQTLGAQFTAQEGEDIFNRAFNPRLSSAENARRIRLEIDGLRKTISNKEAEFKKQGFGVSEGGSAAKKPLPKPSPKMIEAYAKKYDLSIEDAKKFLGVE